MKKIEKFLEFNGNKLMFLSANGNWWIAVKPICEALNVNYNRQFQNLSEMSNKLDVPFAVQQIVDGLKTPIISSEMSNKLDQLYSENRIVDGLKVPKMLSEQVFEAADSKNRKMLCINEFYVYGWIFNLESSNNEELLVYKLKCYGILYNHFRGAITNRKDLLAEKAKVQNRINTLTNKLIGNPAYTEIIQEESKVNKINSQLRKQDNEILIEQRTLWEQDIK